MKTITTNTALFTYGENNDKTQTLGEFLDICKEEIQSSYLFLDEAQSNQHDFDNVVSDYEEKMDLFNTLVEKLTESLEHGETN